MGEKQNQPFQLSFNSSLKVDFQGSRVTSDGYEALEKRGVKYAIRIPANDSLERDIAELLTRPVGRPSHKPVVWYKGFLYQAASWKTARRVVAKVDFTEFSSQTCFSGQYPLPGMLPNRGTEEAILRTAAGLWSFGEN